ncbi:hypothetical protein PLICRDRAFT_40675 [Plicaturopsis crispa FD-325 SS-3]|nr:hypothetical protein PLICRDRAFT_40675 [Plicaturopsis crispa FD-325 SS-3]
MGGAPSKAARKLPKRADTPSWAGARPAPAPNVNPGVGTSRPVKPLASETKNKDIEADARDPHLMANLSRLGPVRVDHHMQAFRPGDAAANTLHAARAQSEAEASSTRPTRNRLRASALNMLLEERKSALLEQRQSASSSATLNALKETAESYDMDAATLERLARYVNSAGVAEGSVSRVVGEDGVERVSMEAAWIEPWLDAPAVETK